MKPLCLLILFILFSGLDFLYSQGDSHGQSVYNGILQGSTVLDNFSLKSDRLIRRSVKRFARYDGKLSGKRALLSSGCVTADGDSAGFSGGVVREPLLDSLRLAYGFTEYAGLTSGRQLAGKTVESLERAQWQLNVTRHAEAGMMQRIEYWKSQAAEHPEYARWIGRMDRERYYYSARVNAFRMMLRNPDILDDRLMSALRSNPLFGDFMASLPAREQHTGSMQPRQLVQQMMQSQASATDPDAARLIGDAQRKGEELLKGLSSHAASFGNIDNALQLPGFTPNPYRTKSLWERIDIGFNLQFDSRTEFMPSAGVAGAQVSFNFDMRFSAGLLASYRFGIGDIKHITVSHEGAGYGGFANYTIWKSLGVQAGYERNRHVAIDVNEILYPASWTSSALSGLTWEYGAGRKARVTAGVFYDFLHRLHTPETNAVLWRMGWKF
ncbi:MAG: hypothetical protein LBV26_00415 [Bacteroidales bacterium]|jgi:hypothetical protein|nr:hypothetical protein [Bacteroidales bacterium]